MKVEEIRQAVKDYHSMDNPYGFTTRAYWVENCEFLLSEIDRLQKEARELVNLVIITRGDFERLKFINDVDRSVADQWRERAEKSEARVKELERAIRKHRDGFVCKHEYDRELYKVLGE
jgi:hypothetical protein